MKRLLKKSVMNHLALSYCVVINFLIQVSNQLVQNSLLWYRRNHQGLRSWPLLDRIQPHHCPWIQVSCRWTQHWQIQMLQTKSWYSAQSCNLSISIRTDRKWATRVESIPSKPKEEGYKNLKDDRMSRKVDRLRENISLSIRKTPDTRKRDILVDSRARQYKATIGGSVRNLRCRKIHSQPNVCFAMANHWSITMMHKLCLDGNC